MENLLGEAERGDEGAQLSHIHHTYSGEAWLMCWRVCCGCLHVLLPLCVIFKKFRNKQKPDYVSVYVCIYVLACWAKHLYKLFIHLSIRLINIPLNILMFHLQTKPPNLGPCAETQAPCQHSAVMKLYLSYLKSIVLVVPRLWKTGLLRFPKTNFVIMSNIYNNWSKLLQDHKHLWHKSQWEWSS